MYGSSNDKSDPICSFSAGSIASPTPAVAVLAMTIVRHGTIAPRSSGAGHGDSEAGEYWLPAAVVLANEDSEARDHWPPAAVMMAMEILRPGTIGRPQKWCWPWR